MKLLLKLRRNPLKTRSRYQKNLNIVEVVNNVKNGKGI